MRRSAPRTSLLAVITAATMTGCAGSGAGNGSGDADPTSVVSMVADYPVYDPTSFLAETEVILEATVLSTEYAVETGTHGGDDPHTNPLSGASEAEMAAAIAAAQGYAVTLTTLRVDVAHTGPHAEGTTVVVSQPGGVIDSVHYEVANSPVLDEGARYLFFATSSPDGILRTVGGPAGQYRLDEGTYVPQDRAIAPWAQIDSAGLAQIIDAAG